MILFSGTSNQPLSQDVASALGASLGNVEITRFIDNECRVFVKENVIGQDVYVLQSLSEVADQHLVELCLLSDAIKDMGARRITAVIPWLGYSKQDKAFRKGEAISSQLVAKFIEAAGFDAVITSELHSENVLPFFHIPVFELSTHTLLSTALFTAHPDMPKADMVVVSPDKGGMSRSERFAKNINLPVIYLTKTRDFESGEVKITGIDGDVSGKTVVVFDDIINTGSTAIKAGEFVKRSGAKSVYFLATHPVLAGHACMDLAQSVIDEIIVTDTIAIPKEKHFEKLIVVSVSSLLADAIRTQTK